MHHHKLDSDELHIEQVVGAGLCSGCGACAGVCFPAAVEMRISEKGDLLPQIDSAKCTGCNICHKVCPGWKLDLLDLNDKVFGKVPENPLVGNFTACYVGYARDEATRFNSSSGGMVTALLLYALKEGFIDGAVVTRMDKNNPLHPEVFIAKTEAEIIQARGSKYCPVPVGIAIKEILKQNGRYAVVGLPCHLQAFRKAEKIFNRLKKNVLMYLGLFCGQTPSYRATTFFLQNQGITRDEITGISYRGCGWPGKMTIKVTELEKKYNLTEYWGNLFGKYYFTLNRCMLCPDFFAEFSDISFGDAWHKDYNKDTKGTSMFIIRSNAGRELIKRASKHNIIYTEKISLNKILSSYRGNIFFKKTNLKSRAFIYRRFLGQKTPLVIESNLAKKVNPASFLWSFLVDFIPITNNKLGSSKVSKFLLGCPPTIFMKVERILHLFLMKVQNKIRWPY